MSRDAALQEFQDRLSIVEVIGGYVALRKTGRNFKALCPFHPEKTPSFVIYPEKQFFICYGCGAGGDVFTFVMKQEHLEFPEAVELLAQKSGLPAPRMRGGPRGADSLAPLLQAHECAARFYEEQLASSPGAQEAREYLKKRGLQPETWKMFQVGFAPDRWEALVSHAGEQGVSAEILERAGLAIRRERGEGCYDRFRGRVLFPIWDARGRVIAFGGRVLAEAEGPKYLNSPETELYVKGRVLYGFHLAVPQIREQDFCIVVEGYLDVATPYQHGFRNVVASMGTSLTEHQVQLIRRHTKHVVMVYDGDYAGQAATLRGLDLLLEAEMRVKVAVLPGGSDPDSLIREQGLEAFARVLRESKELFDYKLGQLTRQFNPRELEGRIGICQEMLPTLKRVPNAIQRGDYIRRLAESLGVAEGLLWTELGRVKLQPGIWRSAAMSEGPAPAPVEPIRPEELLAGLLLEEPGRIAQLDGQLEPPDLQDPGVQELVGWLFTRWREGDLPADHRAALGWRPGQEGRVARWLAAADSVQEKERVMEDLVERIRRERRRSSVEDLRGALQEAERGGNDAEVSRLISQINQLVRR